MASIINAATSGGLISTADTSGILQLQTAGTTAVTVDASQNVGIGTSSPAARLSLIAASANSTAATIGGIEYGGSKRGLTIKTFQSNGGDDCGVDFNAADGLAGYGGFKFSAHTTTLATLNYNGVLALNGASTTANGVGITFPATQSASSNANTLDDYEEGVFTPTIIGSTTAGTGTYTTQTGSYTKVGRVVSFRLQVLTSAHTGTGSLLVASLPFTCSGISGVTIGLLNDLALTAVNYAMAEVVDGSTTVRFRQYPVGGGNISDIAMDTDPNIVLSGTYFTS